MKKPLIIIISIIFIASLFLDSSALAELQKGHKHFAKAAVTKFKKSVNSVRSISILEEVRGTVTLISRNPATLARSIRKVYAGGSKIPPKRKVIKVRGTNDGEIIALDGVGSSGAGYSFFLLPPEELNLTPSGKKKNNKENFSGELPSIITASYENDDEDVFEITAEADYKGVRTSKSGVLKGTFIVDDSDDKAKGRFDLKFSKD